MTGRLKIGITCYPTYGGSGVVATELGLALAERGHEIHFITSRLPVRLQGCSLADVSFHEVNAISYALFRHEPYTLALAAKMAEVAEAFELDLLHVHYAIPHAISAHLAREMLGSSIKVVATLHGTDITLVGNDPSLHSITRFAINKADAATAVSNWLKRETEREFSPETPVKVVHNFINTSRFRPDPGGDWPGSHICSADCPHIIHVSNFRPGKRAHEAVAVFAHVLSKRDARLLMVGDGPELPRAVKLAEELGVAHRVSFLGNREDIARLLAASDIILLPSENESFCLAALEAMASSCAVVATNVGGLPEVVRHNVDGYLCPVGDVAAMAGYINELTDNAGMLARLKESAREHAISAFSVEAQLPRYLAVYEEVLGRKVAHA